MEKKRLDIAVNFILEVINWGCWDDNKEASYAYLKLKPQVLAGDQPDLAITQWLVVTEDGVSLAMEGLGAG
jgi:aspartate/methionine/tyrosine aminotransferase